MSVLVLAEVDGKTLKLSTYQAITAATHWGLAIDVLVYGKDLDAALAEASTITGVRQVLCAQADHLQHPLVEDVSDLVMAIASSNAKPISPASALLIVS